MTAPRTCTRKPRIVAVPGETLTEPSATGAGRCPATSCASATLLAAHAFHGRRRRRPGRREGQESGGPEPRHDHAGDRRYRSPPVVLDQRRLGELYVATTRDEAAATGGEYVAHPVGVRAVRQ